MYLNLDTTRMIILGYNYKVGCVPNLLLLKLNINIELSLQWNTLLCRDHSMSEWLKHLLLCAQGSWLLSSREDTIRVAELTPLVEVSPPFF